MAQTLKFGKGTWATKKGSTLSYNDESNNYKPLPFTTTRSSSATRVNKEGLIEVVENDRPRIDYTDSSNGVLLLEPARTNLLVRSEDFTTSWSKTNGSVTANQVISPDGTQTADLFQENTATGSHDIRQNTAGLTTGVSYTYSIFVKEYSAGSARRIAFYIGGVNSSGVFDFSKETLTSSTFDRAEVVKYKNGWYRLIISDITTGTTFNNIMILDNGSVSSYTGDGSSGVYLWGAMLELGSYQTSYVKTTTAAATRVADTASGAGNSEVFNDSEGVLYVNIAALSNDLTNRAITISDGTSDNRIFISYYAESNGIFSQIISNGSTQSTLTSVVASIKDITKIAVKYKLNDFALWVNGIKISIDSSGNTPIGLNDLSFHRGTGTLNLYGKTKEIGYYDTALTDLELEKLTSYVSLSEMATELNYKAL